MTLKDRTLLELVRRRSAEHPSKQLFAQVDSAIQVVRRLTYADVETRAMSIAASLLEAGARNRQVLLLYAPDFEYICGFLGCIFAGVTAVPAYPPDPARLERSLPRLRAIAADAQCEFVLTTSEIQALSEFMLPQAPELASAKWIATDVIEDARASSWRAPDIRNDAVAFIQYTSGSTGSPKGVVLSHSQLIHNLSLITNAFGIGGDSVGFSWLPPYHDMGLIGGILGPIACGGQSAIMSPLSFLQRPMSWLEGISQFSATTSGGPNFAYELCLRRVGAEDIERLDLRSWGLAFSGAEQIRPDTLDRFSSMFAPCGFRREAFYPCYGLAEATLIVSGGTRGEPPTIAEIDARLLEGGTACPARNDEHRKPIVGCGRPLLGQDVRVVQPATNLPCPDGTVGEIWVSGPSVATSYWRNPELTERTLRATLDGEPGRMFLRTGDLGYLAGGELFVTGRLKDLIIVRGRNLYPQDIERTAEEGHSSLRRGCCAAFAVEIDGNEEMAIAVEIERRYHDRRGGSAAAARHDRRQADRRSERPPSPGDLGSPLAAPSDMVAICEDIRRAVARGHDVRPHIVLLVRAGGLPKTSSGKIQRSETRRLYLAGTLGVLEQSEMAVSSVRRPAVHVEEPPPSYEELGQMSLHVRVSRVAAFLRDLVASGLGVRPEAVPLDVPLSTLGLDSITSVEIAHAVERHLGTLIPASAFLREHTLADVARNLMSDAGSSPLAEMASSGVRTHQHALSPGQEGLWFLQQLDPSSSAYNVASAIRLRAETPWSVVRQAVWRAAARHEVLQTLYVPGEDGSPCAAVQSAPAIGVEEIDATGWPDTELQQRIDDAANEPFDLQRGPILRVHAYLSRGEIVLLLSSHHIALDFWSMTQLLGDMRREVEGAAEPQANGAEVPYRRFVEWQRRHLAAHADRLMTHWQSALSPPPPRLDLPTDRPRPPHQSFRGRSHHFEIPPELADLVRGFAKQHGTTVFVVLLSVYHLLLHRRSGLNDVVVGIPAAGRSRAEFARTVGLLMNIVVVRTRLTGRESLAEFIYQVRRTVLDAVDHQELPFAELVARTQGSRDPSRPPLIDVLFAFEQAQGGEGHALAQLALGVPGATAPWPTGSAEAFPIHRSGAAFDLSLYLTAGDGVYAGWLNYCVDLWDEETAASFAEAYVHALRVCLREPERPLNELDAFATPAERVTLEALNATSTPYEDTRLIHELVAQQAGRSPDSIAVRTTEETLTYAELLGWAEGISADLIEHGARCDAAVGVCLPRSASAVAAQLAVLQAGAAFVPLDPSYPAERLRFMVLDSGISMVLSNAETKHVFDGLPVLHVDPADARVRPAGRPPEARAVSSSSLAYIIYTSGSTGVPKGVGVPHRSVVNFLESMLRDPGLQATDVLAAVTTTSFDIAHLEIFLPLICGARIEMLCGDEIVDGRKLRRALDERGVTVMQATPGLWHVLNSAGGPPPRLRVLCGGEAFPRPLADALLDGGHEVVNLYGPTETTIWSTIEHVRRDPEPVSLGRPIANTQVYVLDECGLRTAPRVRGELFIGGHGVVRGYMGRRALTAERFLPDPYASAPGSRMYRTGDVVAMRRDGRLAFFGRGDGQIKIRGYRVELGEIESALASHALVEEAVVLARAVDGTHELIGYFTSREAAPQASEVQQFLAQTLPGHMVPARLERVASLPRTPNGKIDRKALLGAAADLPAVNAVAATTELERTVCSIYEEVLRRSGIGVEHDFFASGGHSLLATQVATRLGAALSMEVPLRLLFEAPTPRRLAERLADLKATPGSRDGAPLPAIPKARRRLRSELAGNTADADALFGASGRKPGGRSGS